MINTDEIMRIALDLAGYRSVPADSAVHVNGSRINKVFVTIDITLAELIFAKNIGCDAVITHHPIGSSALNFYKVFDRHIDYMVENGIPKESASSAVMSLKERAHIKAHAQIYKQIVDEAKLLRMPLVNIHQPCDEIMRKIIYEAIISGKTESVSQIIDSIANIPEFSRAETKIMVCHGDREAKAGRWALVVAAGTNGGFHIAKEYYKHDVSTVIYLHIDSNELLRFRQENLQGNLVVLGHLAGDSIGLNVLSEKLEEKGIQTVRAGLI